ncbi:hypothetical protein Q7P37_000605 [Cladosporium fusiforme]
MSTKRTNNNPPAYEQNPPLDKSPQDIIDRVQTAVNASHRRIKDEPAETQRLRNFMLYCMAIDYRVPLDFELKPEDREHYLEMAEVVNNMRQIHKKGNLGADSRRTLAPYLRKFLHAPCSDLGIPLETAVDAVDRHVVFLNIMGRYKGCIRGDLHMCGLADLATRLYMDNRVLIPRLATSDEMQMKLTEGVTEIARCYFSSIAGFESAIKAGSDLSTPFAEDFTVKYTLNERGKNYRKERESMLEKIVRWVEHIRYGVISGLLELNYTPATPQEVFPKSSEERICNGDCMGRTETAPEERVLSGLCLPHGAMRNPHSSRICLRIHRVRVAATCRL